ncbi:hypothetical protein Hanom_Chr14g01314851 [Helianthus anomalus]
MVNRNRLTFFRIQTTNYISLDSRDLDLKTTIIRWLSDWSTWWPSSQHHALSSCSSTSPCNLSSISPPHDRSHQNTIISGKPDSASVFLSFFLANLN